MDRLVPCSVVALAAGIALARHLPAPALPPAAALAAALPLLLALPSARRLRRLLPQPFRDRVSPTLLALALLLGAARGALARMPGGPDDLEALLPPGPLPLRIEGMVVVPPDLPAAVAGREADGTPRLRGRMSVEADTLLGAAPPRPVSGRVLVLLDGEPPVLAPGDRVRLTGVVRRPSPPGNPGERDRASAARERGAAVLLEVPSPGGVERLGEEGGSGPEAWVAGVRASVLTAVHRACEGRGAAVAEALLVGRQDGLDGELVRDFRRSGTYHILVVSGFHVALAAAAAALVLRRAGAGAGATAAGAVLAAAAFTGVSGMGKPSERALVAVALVSAAPWFRRRSDPLHALALAAGVILFLEPGALDDAGFQLTVAAVLGLLRLAPGIGAVLFARRRFLRRFPIPAADRSLRRRLGDVLERALPPALGAFAATAPVLAARFGTVCPVTPLANLVVLPLAMAVLALAVLLLPAGALVPGATAVAMDAAAGVLAATVHAFASLPLAWYAIPPPPAWLLVADGAVLALAMARRPAGPRALAAAALGLLALAAAPRLLPPSPPAPSLLALRVGHGMAVLADSGDARALFDAGGRGGRVGEDAILPALLARGVVCLDALFVSHEDSDHGGEALLLLETLRVRLLVVGEGFGRCPLGAEVLAAARRAGVPVHRAAAGDRVDLQGLRIDVLHPARGANFASDNDGSLVLRATLDGLSAILPGDLEEAGTRALLLSGADLGADVLLLPHHGSARNPGLVPLAAATRARLAIASAGPATGAVRSLRIPGAPPVLVTEETGAVLVRPGGEPETPWRPGR